LAKGFDLILVKSFRYYGLISPIRSQVLIWINEDRVEFDRFFVSQQRDRFDVLGLLFYGFNERGVSK